MFKKIFCQVTRVSQFDQKLLWKVHNTFQWPVKIIAAMLEEKVIFYAEIHCSDAVLYFNMQLPKKIL